MTVYSFNYPTIVLRSVRHLTAPYMFVLDVQITLSLKHSLYGLVDKHTAQSVVDKNFF